MNSQRLVILLLVIAYIFSPTLFDWIINPEGAWYRPFIIWVVVIIIAFVMQIRRKKYHEFD
jgi:energy-coupling factor transporter transmembrane protein EcfT